MPRTDGFLALPVVSTDSLPGFEIVSVLGNPIVADAVGMNIQVALEYALEQLRTKAHKMGADAVVGFGLTRTDKEVTTKVTVYGTPVGLRSDDVALKT